MTHGVVEGPSPSPANEPLTETPSPRQGRCIADLTETLCAFTHCSRHTPHPQARPLTARPAPPAFANATTAGGVHPPQAPARSAPAVAHAICDLSHDPAGPETTTPNWPQSLAEAVRPPRQHRLRIIGMDICPKSGEQHTARANTLGRRGHWTRSGLALPAHGGCRQVIFCKDPPGRSWTQSTRPTSW